MSSAKQSDQFLRIRTPLGENVLLISSLEGEEAISELFNFRVGLKTANGTSIPFDAIVNKQAVIELAAPDAPTRYVHGIVKSFTEAEQDDVYTYYEAEIVPPLWRLTRTVNSRIFQQKSVKEILTTVLVGLDVDFHLHATYYPHNICTQYRESNFEFASRLMEEHGIYYYFVHSADNCRLVLSDSSMSSPIVEGGPIRFDPVHGESVPERRITRWRKTQEARSGKVAYQDAHFQLPGQNLAAASATLPDVEAGTVRHNLAVGNADWEIFEGRGEYAHMFDELTTGLADVFKQKEATAQIRMQQETSEAIRIAGAGYCWQMTPGCHFELQNHFNGNGAYLITSVAHRATIADHRAGEQRTSYANEFSATPVALPYRPQLKTPKPKMFGTLTATVVGPPGEVVYTDKYGRIKVQFHWDRLGRNNADSSCWLRPFTPNAGAGFGILAIPRIGQEVMVVFHEGDPDEPHVIGAAHNPKNMPPANLPDERTQSIFKTQSFHGDNTEVSALAFDSTPGRELIHLHSQKDTLMTSEHNHLHAVANAHQTVAGKVNLRRTGGKILPAKAPSGSGAGGSDLPTRTPGGSWFGYGSMEGLVDYLDPPEIFHIGLDSVEVVGMLSEYVIGMGSSYVLGSASTAIVNPFAVPGLAYLGDNFKFGQLAAGGLASYEYIFGANATMTTRQETAFRGGSQLDFFFKGEAGANAVFKLWTDIVATARAVEMFGSIFVDACHLDSDAWTVVEVAVEGAGGVLDMVMNHFLGDIAFAESIAGQIEAAAFLDTCAGVASTMVPEAAGYLFACSLIPAQSAEILGKDKLGQGNAGPGAIKQTSLQGTIAYTASNFSVFTKPGPMTQSNILLAASGVAGESGNVAVLGASSVMVQSGTAIVSCLSNEETGLVNISVSPAGSILIGNTVAGEPNQIAILPESTTIRAIDVIVDVTSLISMMAVDAISIVCGESSIVFSPDSIDITSPTITLNGTAINMATSDMSIEADNFSCTGAAAEFEFDSMDSSGTSDTRAAANTAIAYADLDMSGGACNMENGETSIL